MPDTDYRKIFAKNRAEELGADLSEHFVIPPYFDRVRLGSTQKASVIIGGRGCGKTMLLRYLSHHTAFSVNRSIIHHSAIKHIGLYWRADTQFTNSLVGRGVAEDVWASAFGHLAAVSLSLELLDSLWKLASSSFPSFHPHDLGALDFKALSAFDPTLDRSFSGLRDGLVARLWSLEAWVNNARKIPEPLFLPCSGFLAAVLSVARNQIGVLAESVFYVYLDEYENLALYQKEIVNTWVKHGAPPLIFNLAMKRNGFETRETTGPESLSDIHDFRQHDLEQYSLEGDFELFASEILFLQLSRANGTKEPVDPEILRDPDQLSLRKDRHYKVRLQRAAQQMFPEPKHEELAHQALADPALNSLLKKRVAAALKERGVPLGVADFIDPAFPRASLIMPALLQRKNLSPQEVAGQFARLKQNEQTKFDGWTHNNFFACLLHLYAPDSRACPLYAGFPTFCRLAHGNIRHLLELCHKSIYKAVDRELGAEAIDPMIQAEAAKQTATAFLAEIRSFGRHGNRLHTFVLRLGTLFQLAHLRPTQSEPEQNHFAITSGLLAQSDEAFLQEAVKWSVLFEEQSTKKKKDYESENHDYVLAPIYSAYFHISFRKKRKIELSADEARVLAKGDEESVQKLFRRYRQDWRIEEADPIPSLFAELAVDETQS